MKRILLFSLLLTGCAGLGRQCSSWSAERFGSDWLVVQYNNAGQVLKCWKLHDTSIDNEGQSDGIYWKSADGHLIHLAGWYNRVQVTGSDFAGAAKDLGVDLSVCH